MPIYEYQCKKCGSTFEKIQRFSDEPLTVHENCGGAVKRLISPPAFQFKGSGFYITDYAKSNGKGSVQHTKKEEAPAAKPESSTSSTTTTSPTSTPST